MVTSRVLHWRPVGVQFGVHVEKEAGMGERKDVQIRVSVEAAEAIRRRAEAERRTVIAVVDGLVFTELPKPERPVFPENRVITEGREPKARKAPRVTMGANAHKMVDPAPVEPVEDPEEGAEEAPVYPTAVHWQDALVEAVREPEVVKVEPRVLTAEEIAEMKPGSFRAREERRLAAAMAAATKKT
jgi:hypothetical protein